MVMESESLGSPAKEGASSGRAGAAWAGTVSHLLLLLYLGLCPAGDAASARVMGHC